jgi:hypothetical protein
MILSQMRTFAFERMVRPQGFTQGELPSNYGLDAAYVTAKIVSANHFLKSGLSLNCLNSSV